MVTICVDVCALVNNNSHPRIWLLTSGKQVRIKSKVSQRCLIHAVINELMIIYSHLEQTHRGKQTFNQPTIPLLVFSDLRQGAKGSYNRGGVKTRKHTIKAAMKKGSFYPHPPTTQTSKRFIMTALPHP